MGKALGFGFTTSFLFSTSLIVVDLSVIIPLLFFLTPSIASLCLGKRISAFWHLEALVYRQAPSLSYLTYPTKKP